jgi:membrane dipeptidase
VTIDRREFVRIGAGSALGLAALQAGAAAAAAAHTGPAADPEAAAANRASAPLIIDALGGFANPNLGESDITTAAVDDRGLRDARASGLTAVNQTVGYVNGAMDPFEHSVAEVADWDRLIRSRDAELLKVLTAADIRRARETGRIGVILGFQNAAMMGSDPRRVAVFANLGVRVIQLTYNVRNQLGDGAMVGENHGLTTFGREVVHALNENRVMVDLSHSGEQTCIDAIAESRSPVIISHTGCRAIADLPRNKSDRELRAVAERGGLVGVYFMPFLAIGRQPTADDLLAHIEHAVTVCGEDHVCIGTDGTVSQIDDMTKYLEELKDEVATRKAAGIAATGERADIVPFLPDLQGPGKFHRLAQLLSERGHPASRIEKILGGNFLGFAERTW